MSRTKPSDLDDIALQLPCPYCKAAAGDWCITSGYEWSAWLHNQRFTPIREAWGLGYQEYEHYLARSIEQDGFDSGRIVRSHARHCSICIPEPTS